MMAVTFDTLKFARKLEKAGFTQEQAVGTAEAFAEAATDELVTKSVLKGELSDLENRMTQRLLTFMAAQTALIIGALFAIAKGF